MMNGPESDNAEEQPIALGFMGRGRRKINSARELLKFMAWRRFRGFQIGDQPWLDEESGAFFLEMLQNSTGFLEYGSGGSTVLAKRMGKDFISIDTDPFLLKAVREKVGKLGPGQYLEYANIGWTGVYGVPVFRSPRVWRRRRWRAYLERPWRHTDGEHLPDLVLVDGRFRVAAALTSCAHLAGMERSRILVDDYLPRPWYRPIAEYAQLVEMRGRMAVFQPPAERSPKILEAIERFLPDCR